MEGRADDTPDSGQVCTASSRAYIQKAAVPAFRKLIVAEMAKLKRGSPLDATSEMGPQADQKQAGAVKRYLDIGNHDGKVLTGGGPDTGLGPNYIQPTVFTNVADTSAINTQEVFGPVLILHEFETEEEAIRRANDTECELCKKNSIELQLTFFRYRRPLCFSLQLQHQYGATRRFSSRSWKRGREYKLAI